MNQIKILLVDDNIDNLMSMEVVLEKDGYSFVKATSGREALSILLKEEDFSLILLDIRMPIMDGYETAELIYQRDKLRHIPIIFISGQDDEEAAVFKGYLAGAVDYIRKPFNTQILRSKVAVFAELYRKNQILIAQEEKLTRINDDLRKLNQELEDRVKERTKELENLNHELKDLNLSKDKFLSVISHDLRNPLTALLASSDRLKKTNNENSTETQHLATIIHRTSNKILEQLNELVNWAKNQREKTSFNPVSIQLRTGIDVSLEILKTNSNQKDIVLENNIRENVFVKADVFMLRSIIQNLVMNAIKYSPQGGIVSVSANYINSMVEICVQDTGVGMTPEVQQNLFKNISPVSVAGTANETGSGLGLLLVRDFVTQHGGTISIDSEPGKGTCFKFTVPADDVPEMA
ncbi:MAG: hybrid sensor histidine kinase/response regulator [Daejeonella sp.]|uniref:hybrid sensor histidine kinase/response regulator n=1 Tax=Daejeonella sp. JGW-45 TaxID=3034148 RepID=UPI0023EB9218|nr:hybrid sensor histidine kinase/response regulator [Daejeonella sp. JGW-45]